MDCFHILLCLLIYCSASCALNCIESTEYTVSLTPTGPVTRNVSDKVTLSCSTNIQSAFPRWDINDISYRYTGLPPGYTADGLKLEFIFDFEVEIRCFFRLYVDGSTIDICSNKTVVIPANNREEGDLPECQFQNITFFNGIESSDLHIGSAYYGQSCSMLASLNNQPKENVTIPDNNLTLSIEPIAPYYGINVTMKTKNNCDVCQANTYFLPRMHKTEYISIESDYTGPIIDDLTNKYFDFTSNAADPIVCTYSESDGVPQCLLDGQSCSIGPLRLPACSEGDGKRLVLAGTIYNGTEVSILVPGINDRGIVSQVMVFNFIILICPDCGVNATCQDGNCVCDPGYSGNGNICEPIPIPSPTPTPSSTPSTTPTAPSGAVYISRPHLVIILCSLVYACIHFLR